MKKLYLFALILPLAAFSCTEDVPATKNPSLGVDPPTMVFPSRGETQTFRIEVKDLDAWRAYSDISWIELGEPDLAAGTIDVTVKPTEDILDKSGKIIIYSDIEEVARVDVTQTGNGIIHDRPTAQRMNFRGQVKEVGFFFNPCYIWEINPDYMYDLFFDEAGRLVKFSFEEHDNVSFHALHTAEVTYDDSNRPLVMDMTSTANISQGVPFRYKLTFEYGDSGKYFETAVIMDLLYQWAGIYTGYRTWLPRMLRGLEKIGVESNGISVSDIYFDFEVTGDTGTCTLYGKNSSGQSMQQELYDYSFDGKFTQWIQYKAVFSGLDNVLHQREYVVDRLSGYIVSEKLDIIDAGFIGMEKFYHPNPANSFYKYNESVDYGYVMDVEYNERWDVSSVTESYWGLGAGFEYTYDEHGNWTSLIENAAPRATYEIEAERTITYYE